MAVENQYITAEQLTFIFDDLNFDVVEAKAQDILDRATGDFEFDLSERYVIPLVAPEDGGVYLDAPEYARKKVLNVLKAKIRAIISIEQDKNRSGSEGAEKYVNTWASDYKRGLTDLLDPKKPAAFRLADFAGDAQTTVQRIALSRADNEPEPFHGLSYES